jgi:hypothetical protein
MTVYRIYSKNKGRCLYWNEIKNKYIRKYNIIKTCCFEIKKKKLSKEVAFFLDLKGINKYIYNDVLFIGGMSNFYYLIINEILTVEEVNYIITELYKARCVKKIFNQSLCFLNKNIADECMQELNDEDLKLLQESGD